MNCQYVKSDYIFRIYIYELHYVFCTIALSSAELRTFSVCHTCSTSVRNTYHNMEITPTFLKYYTSQRNIASKSFEYIFDVLHVCISATCDLCHLCPSGRNLTTSLGEKMNLFSKLRSKVIPRSGI